MAAELICSRSRGMRQSSFASPPALCPCPLTFLSCADLRPSPRWATIPLVRIRAATETDLPAIQALLREANDTPYDIAQVAHEKCFEPSPAGPPTTLVAGNHDRLDGVLTSAPGSLRLLAVRRESRRRGVGSALLAAAIASAGASLTVFGEAGNYLLPGVPEGDAASLAFYRSRGFEEVEERPSNLVVPLGENPLVPQSPPAGVSRVSSIDRDEVLAFIRAEFGRAWAWEASRAAAAETPTLMVLRGSDGRPCGFSAHDANNRGLGFFGPMGVAPSARGRGAGRALLLASLADLRRIGYSEAVISWVANEGFYERVASARPHLKMIRFRSRPQNPL